MNKLLQTKDLCKSFSAGGVQQHVLVNLNISINEGEFVVVMGSSGSGKSTLLYALSGMDKINIGDIMYGDEKIDAYSNDELAMFRRKNCGFVFQDYFLNDNMSLLDNVLVSVFAPRREKKAYVEKARKLLVDIGIEESLFHKFPTQLSGGESQRVGFVRAIINDPSILFADEPTGALNSKAAEDMLNLFNEYNQKGNAVILVTHDIRTAIRGSRILYLKDGEVLNELELGEYSKVEQANRISQLTAFLEQMGW